MEYYSVINEIEIKSFEGKLILLRNTMPRKINLTEKDKYSMLSAICRTYTYENINDMSRKSGLFEGGNQ
jgi:hypothetical protein